MNFSQFTYGLTFREAGLPAGTTWTVTMGNVTRTGAGDVSLTGLVNGTYNFDVQPESGYVANVTSGAVAIHGHSMEEWVGFSPSPSAMFLGLPGSAGWIVLGAAGVTIAAVGLAAVAWGVRRRSPGSRSLTEGAETRARDEGEEPTNPAGDAEEPSMA